MVDLDAVRSHGPGAGPRCCAAKTFNDVPAQCILVEHERGDHRAVVHGIGRWWSTETVIAPLHAEPDQGRATVSVFVDDAYGDPSITRRATPLPAAIDLFRATSERDGRVAAEREVADEYELTDDEVVLVGALADMVDRMVCDG